MLFSSIPFLFWFLPGVLILYAAAPGSLKNTVLLLSSLFFYGWGEPRYVIWMMLAILMAYIFGLLIERYQSVPKLARLFLALSVSSSLLMLGYFKYADFFIRNVNAVTGCSISLLNITLPIGISFYTFQILSYTVDVYRQDVKAQRNLIDLATYVALFPQLIAGPIVRYSDIAEQLKGRIHTMGKTAQGIRRFILGLGKKILIANLLGELCSIFRASDDKSVLFFWLYAVAYTLHVYFDFSGYSDMAIGLGKLFGFDFLENFNYPFISKSITEFWRRWHMSLGSWFRDYIYIPLGGNRVSTLKHIRNILVVWALTGLWHGASWNFVLWGVYYGLFLLLEKFVLQKFLDRMPSWLRTVYTMLVVMIGWVFFSQTDFSALGHYLGTMFGIRAAGFIDRTALYYLKTGFILLLISILACRPTPYQHFKRLVRRRPTAAVVINLVLFALSVAYMVYNSYTPFLYAKF